MDLYKGFNPLVSIIIPTFNRANLLLRAIDSVIKQGFTEWELLIVDDGSSDDTFSVVDSAVQKNENIRYIKHKNRKVALTLNAGILAGSGKYITFLGSDDEYKPDHLEKRIEYVEKSNVDVIHGGIEVIGDKYVFDKNDLSKRIHLSECILGGTLFGKKEVFLNLEGFKNLDYSSESDLIERAEKKYKIEKVNFPTYIYHRDTPDSICNNIREKNMFLIKMIELSNNLSENSEPKWGSMAPQHMIEHLIDTIKVSNGKISVNCSTEDKKLIVLKKVLMSKRLLPKNYSNPSISYEYRHQFENLNDAVENLKNEVNDFYKYFENNPEAKLTSPIFGELNKAEWEQFNKKHIGHHFLQFSLMAENELLDVLEG